MLMICQQFVINGIYQILLLLNVINLANVYLASTICPSPHPASFCKQIKQEPPATSRCCPYFALSTTASQAMFVLLITFHCKVSAPSNWIKTRRAHEHSDAFVDCFQYPATTLGPTLQSTDALKYWCTDVLMYWCTDALSLPPRVQSMNNTPVQSRQYRECR